VKKFEAPEILFHPYLIRNESPGVHEMLYNAINVSKIFLYNFLALFIIGM
jgi:Actin.